MQNWSMWHIHFWQMFKMKEDFCWKATLEWLKSYANKMRNAKNAGENSKSQNPIKGGVGF